MKRYFLVKAETFHPQQYEDSQELGTGTQTNWEDGGKIRVFLSNYFHFINELESEVIR